MTTNCIHHVLANVTTLYQKLAKRVRSIVCLHYACKLHYVVFSGQFFFLLKLHSSLKKKLSSYLFWSMCRQNLLQYITWVINNYTIVNEDG